MRKILLATAALIAAPAAGLADETMDCAKASWADSVGTWDSSVHYLDFASGGFGVWSSTARIEATEDGYAEYQIGDDGEYLSSTTTFTETGFREESLSPEGEVTDVVAMDITSCSGPDEDGFYTMKSQGTWTSPDGETLAIRGKSMSSENSGRMIGEYNPEGADGDTWLWGRHAVFVRKDGEES